jgi:hypothetical protein
MCVVSFNGEAHRSYLVGRSDVRSPNNDNGMLHFKVATTDFLFLDSYFKAQRAVAGSS